MNEVNKTMKFDSNSVILEGVILDLKLKLTCKKVKTEVRKSAK